MNPYKTPLKNPSNVFSAVFTPSPELKNSKKFDLSSSKKSPEPKKQKSAGNSIINLKKIDAQSYVDDIKKKVSENLPSIHIDLTLGSLRYYFMVSLIFYNLFSLTAGYWELLIYFAVFFGLKIMNPPRGTKLRLLFNLLFVFALNHFFLDLMNFSFNKAQFPRMILAGLVINFANVVNYIDSESYLELIFQFFVQIATFYFNIDIVPLRKIMIVIQCISFISGFFLFSEFVDYHVKDVNVNYGDAYLILKDNGSIIEEVKTKIIDHDKFLKLLDSAADLSKGIEKAKIENYTNSKINIEEIFRLLCRKLKRNEKSPPPSEYSYYIVMTDGIWKNENIVIVSIYGTKILSKSHHQIPRSSNVIRFDPELDMLSESSEDEEEPRIAQSPSLIYRSESQEELNFTSPTIQRKHRPEFLTMTKSIDNIDIEEKKIPISEEERVKIAEKDFDRRLLNFTEYGTIDERYEDGERYMDLLKKIYKQDGENKLRVKTFALKAILDSYGKPTKEENKEAYHNFKANPINSIYDKYSAEKLLSLNTIEARKVLRLRWANGDLEDLKAKFEAKLKVLEAKVKETFRMDSNEAVKFEEGKYKDLKSNSNSPKKE